MSPLRPISDISAISTIDLLGISKMVNPFFILSG